MNLFATPLEGVIRVETRSHGDERGAFTRLFCTEALAACLGERHIVQINQSRTRYAGTVRGMHYQRPPHAEMKLVRCLRGRVWDVVVDLRRESPTFLRWHAEELSADNQAMLVIPEGCAHGFQALEDHSEMLYLHTAAYQPGAEGGVRPDDPRLAITWPLPLGEMSPRDRSHPLLTPDFVGIQP
ncbi:dTDP-4-dehydrorhamnose 3,5-epimerase [Pseudomonas indica]|uniref:dTDP-4-dehydrorhamnose 3,5-epimerase n=1 Tax=Pseudomonas indica TaxID=137658 RepID=UPI003FD67B75